MDRKLGAVAALLLASGGVSASNYCALTALGPNCSFYDLASCQMHLQGVGGQCVANPQALSQSVPPPPAPVVQYQPAPILQHPDIAGAAMRGYQQGQQLRLAQEEHAARMRLLEAQTYAAQQPQPIPQAAAPADPQYLVFYRCPGAEPEYTSVPAVGCIVVGAVEL